jgi:Polyketide cyclase / dehydrase and lipid transport
LTDVLRDHGLMEISRHIERSAAAVSAFASDPRHLPQWAAGLSSSVDLVDGQWRTQSPMGPVSVRFAPPNDEGILDHTVVLPDGETVHNRLRVRPDGEGCVVTFTLSRRPGMSEEDLAADAAAVRQDLDRLKALLEGR